MRDLELVAIIDGPPAHPRVEHGLDGQLELFEDVGWEGLPGFLLDQVLELLGHRSQVVGVEVGVLTRAGRLPGLLEDVIELLSRDVEHDPPEHTHKAPVGIPGEALVAGLTRQAGDCVVVQAKVQDGVHHAWHRFARTRPHRDQERIRGIAQLASRLLLEPFQRGERLVPQPGWELVAGAHVCVTRSRGDGERRRHGQSRLRHRRQTGALAA